MYTLLIAILGGLFGWCYRVWAFPLLEKDINKIYPIEVHLTGLCCISLMLIDWYFGKLTQIAVQMNIILSLALVVVFRWLYRRRYFL